MKSKVFLLALAVVATTVLLGGAQGQNVQSLALKFNALPMATVVQSNPLIVSDFLTDVWGRLARVYDTTTENVILRNFRPAQADPQKATELLFSVKDVANNVEIKDSTSANYDRFAATLKNTLLGSPAKDITSQLTFGDVAPTEVNLDRNFYQALVGVNVDELLVQANWPPAFPALSDAEKQADELKKRNHALQIRLTKQSVSSYKADYSALLSVVTSLQNVAAKILNVDPNSLFFLGVFEGSVVFRFTVYPALEDELSSYEAKWTSAIKSGDATISSVFPDTDFSYAPVADLKTDPTPTEPPFGYDEVTTTTPAPAEESDSGTSTGLVAGAVVGSVAGVAALAGVAAAGAKYRNRLAAQQEAHSMDERSPGADGISPGGLANVDIHGERTPNIHNPM